MEQPHFDPDLDPVGIGIEGTHAPFQNRDTLEVTGHYTQWWKDFALVKDLGIREFRYPIPWDKIEPKRGRRDWALMDGILHYIYDELGLSIIADTLHHTLPTRFVGGFLDPRMMDEYPDFVAEFAQRYPFVKKYVPFNEPTATLDFCGYRGWWQPHLTGDKWYVFMLRHAARAAAEAAHRVRQITPDAQIIHVDTAEHHAALDEASEPRAHFLNERRFLFDELLLGKVGEGHSLYSYLRQHDYEPEMLEWHQANPIKIDIRGVNYYKLNEEQLLNGETHNAPSRNPRGFAEVAYDYYERLGLPLRMTETNIQGYVTDRISWLKYMRGQYELLRERLPKGYARGFDWYPLFDCKGWFVLLQEGDWPWDPQGIYWCSDDNARHASDLSHWYRHLVTGGLAADLPAYAFQPGIQKELAGFLPQMQWDWIATEGQS